MQMKVFNLASGSKGNCTYINAAGTHILIDVGLCFDEINEKLKAYGVKTASIDAILISHEHTDHIKGLQKFLKQNPCVQIYAHPKTIIKISEKFYIPMGNQNPIIQSSFYIKDLTINAFSLSHDSSHCLGYSFFENGKKFSIATDTGYVSDELMLNLKGSDFVFIECNYNLEMLYYCEKYPHHIKERIISKLGHLSNDDCCGVIEKLIESGTKCFALAHISENTNTYELALKTIKDYLTLKHLLSDNIFITTLNQYEKSEIFEI